jgi:8-oxo-dGTP pyrophosphatase MutT (NUDIX family)
VLIPQDARVLDRLRHRLAAGQLPGAVAQYRMAHQLRKNYGVAPDDARRAGVLALLYPIESRLHLLFIQRTSPANDRHAGQIGFPGGSAEPVDNSPADTALRETEEEVGVYRDSVELLGGLSDLYIPVSNFLVHPYVGFRPERPEFTVQESEVARTLELPLQEFLQPSARQLLDKELGGGLTLTKVPHWVVNQEAIWGATAMMVAEMLALLEQ